MAKKRKQNPQAFKQDVKNKDDGAELMLKIVEESRKICSRKVQHIRDLQCAVSAYENFLEKHAAQPH